MVEILRQQNKLRDLNLQGKKRNSSIEVLKQKTIDRRDFLESKFETKKKLYIRNLIQKIAY